MKKFHIFFILTFIVVSGAVQFGFSPEPLQDEKAKRILDDSKAVFESLKDFSATFSYSLSNATMKSAEVKKFGKIKYKKGMYFIQFGDQEIYCDLESQWIYLSESNEVNIIAYDPEESVSIESIFSVYSDGVQTRYDGQETLQGHQCHKIFLASTDRGQDYNQAYLWINARTKILEKATLIDRRQTRTTYEFSKIKTNTGLTSAAFVFNPKGHPGVDIYDER